MGRIQQWRPAAYRSFCEAANRACIGTNTKGVWPKEESGEIPGADGTTWVAVTMALSKGRRGLPGGTTLAKFLAEHVGVQLRAKR